MNRGRTGYSFRWFLVLIFVLSACKNGPPTAPDPSLPTVTSDVNGDDYIDQAAALLEFLLGGRAEPSAVELWGDANADGAIDWADLALLGQASTRVTEGEPNPSEHPPDEPDEFWPPISVEDLLHPAPKVAVSDEELRVTLGDVNGDGQVDQADAYVLFEYLLEGRTSPLCPWCIHLGDVTGNGAVTWTDLARLGQWLNAGSPPDNRHGIGREIVIHSAHIEPDPSLTQFSTDGTWQPFTVRTMADSVKVVVNEPGTDIVLEIAGGSRAPSRNYCGGEISDSRRRRNGQRLYLAGCASGQTEVVVKDFLFGIPLATYPVTVGDVHPDNVDGSFNIDLVFVDPAFTEIQKTFIRQAADRWEEVITEDLEDVDFQQRPFEFSAWSPVTDIVDDLRIFVHRLSEGSYGGRAGVYLSRHNGKPVLAWMSFSRTLLSQAEDVHQWRKRHPHTEILLKGPEEGLVNLALHEIGHCLGIGVKQYRKHYLGEGDYKYFRDDSAWLWLLSVGWSGPHFTGPLAIQAFYEAGGDSYAGEGVPIEEDWTHWRDSVFTNSPGEFYSELMSPSGSLVWGAPTVSPLAYKGEGLSAITIAALADMGYEVDFSQADPYRLPPPAGTAKPLGVGSGF